MKNSVLPKIIVIVGPTASGKSDLAVRLAQRFNGEIVSADSRQVYKGMDVGSGKITIAEMHGIPHHLLNVASPSRKFTVEKYKKLATKVIADIIKRHQTDGGVPIICGGTGFYIDALVDGVEFPNVPPNQKLRTSLAKIGQKNPAKLLSILKKLDPTRAKNIDPHNLRRIIRAIEIAKALGTVPSLTKKSARKNTIYDPLFIGINPDSKILRTKIRARLLDRLENQGMVEEVQNLHTNGLSWKRLEEFGLEYRFIALFLQKKITREQMIERLTFESWHYAKRQLTWFHRNTRIQWFTSGKNPRISKAVKHFLTQK